MAVFKTEAIVLKQYDLGEADKIITFYTKDNGKVRAVARGVRKGKNSGLLLPFTYNYLTVYQGKSLDRINQIKNIFSFAPLREDISKMAYASFMAELVEKVGMPADPDEALFSLLLTTYHQLLKASEKEIKYININFKARILGLLGLKPELDFCVSCKEKIPVHSRNTLVLKQGGIVCNNCCYQEEGKGYQLSGEALQVFKRFFKPGLKLSKLKISGEAFNELDSFIDDYMVYHLDIHLKSAGFLNMIKNLG